MSRTGSSKPRVRLLVDRPGWAYDFVARSMAARLRGRYDLTIS